MLKTIPSILGPDLLHALRAMGHGDELAIVDANFPGASASTGRDNGSGPRLLRLDGHAATDVLEAILTLLPLDDFVDECAIVMEVVDDPDAREPIMMEFEEIILSHERGVTITSLERFKFYDRVFGAYAVVQTGETRLYGNIILKKGVVRPTDQMSTITDS